VGALSDEEGGGVAEVVDAELVGRLAAWRVGFQMLRRKLVLRTGCSVGGEDGPVGPGPE
jgi:hypothetical protein